MSYQDNKKISYQNNFVSLDEIFSVIAAQGDVEELGPLTKLLKTGADVTLEVVPSENEKKYE